MIGQLEVSNSLVKNLRKVVVAPNRLVVSSAETLIIRVVVEHLCTTWHREIRHLGRQSRSVVEVGPVRFTRVSDWVRPRLN